MPVYIRKNVSYTPPSIDKIPVEDEDDYVNDPEQIRDQLPQPFRMIDKTLRNLLDDTWAIIAEREEDRLAEARRVRPPQYDYAIILDGPIPGSNLAQLQQGQQAQQMAPGQQVDAAAKQSMKYATCMADSTDGKYIYIGLPHGLVALDALSQTYHGLWEEVNTEITFIKSYPLSSTTNLIATIDDMGIARLFSHTNSRFFLMKVMNTNPQDSDNKTLVSKLELSKQGDYAGMVMENPMSKDVWLEIHKLPRDTWISEIDTLVAAFKKKEEKKEEASEDSESNADQEGEATQQPSVPPADTSEPSQLSASSQRSKKSYASLFSKPPSIKKSRASSADPGDQPLIPESRRDITVGEPKFSQPQLVMKVKTAPPITGNMAPSLHVACGKIDTGDVIGTGQNHILSQNHLELRQTAFDHLHDNLLRYLPKDEESDCVQAPRFHFLTAGRILPQGMEQSSLEGRPTTLAVWWPGSTNLMQYSLVKTSKDIEFKPDLVWPFTCKITATTTSDDSSVIAIGLENGNVVIWDRYMGTQRGVVTVASDVAVTQMKFLDPSLFPQEKTQYPPYPTKTGAYLLVMCANSAVYAVGTGPGLMSRPNCISPPVEKDNEGLTLMEPFTAQPDLLMVVLRKGTIQLRSCLQGTTLCDIHLPETHELTSPWEPVLALGGLGQMLYVKGTKKEEVDGEEGDTGAQSGAVFVYQLRSFKTLDPYMKTQRPSVPFSVHTKLEERVNALLADRIAQQSNRQSRMQERWLQLRDEIDKIHQNKEEARVKAEARPVHLPLP